MAKQDILVLDSDCLMHMFIVSNISFDFTSCLCFILLKNVAKGSNMEGMKDIILMGANKDNIGLGDLVVVADPGVQVTNVVLTD